jgi:hypothetical protein
MHFLFNLLRIKGLYKLRALLAHPQESLHKRHLVQCQLAAPGLKFHLKRGLNYHFNPGGAADITLNIPSFSFCSAPPEDEQVMFETSRGS